MKTAYFYESNDTSIDYFTECMKTQKEASVLIPIRAEECIYELFIKLHNQGKLDLPNRYSVVFEVETDSSGNFMSTFRPKRVYDLEELWKKCNGEETIIEEDGTRVTTRRRMGKIHGYPAITRIRSDPTHPSWFTVYIREYYENGRMHRDHDLPAYEDLANDIYKWYHKGLNMRMSGAPAVIEVGNDHELWKLTGPQVRRSERLRAKNSK